VEDEVSPFQSASCEKESRPKIGVRTRKSGSRRKEFLRMKALLVIDMINDFLNPRGALYCGEGARKIIPRVRDLVDAFVAKNHLIVYLKDAHDLHDKEFELFHPHAIQGTWGGEVIPELAPPPGARVVDKKRFTAFYGTDLGKILAEAHPEEVWVSGVVTSICVMDTVGDLRNRDYTVVVPVAAVADFDPQFHDFALKRMQRVYGARLVEEPGTAGGLKKIC
jgi:nicotinamidase-related amidase